MRPYCYKGMCGRRLGSPAKDKCVKLNISLLWGPGRQQGISIFLMICTIIFLSKDITALRKTWECKFKSKRNNLSVKVDGLKVEGLTEPFKIANALSLPSIFLNACSLSNENAPKNS